MITLENCVDRYLSVGCREKALASLREDASCARRLLTRLAPYSVNADRALARKGLALTGAVVHQYRADRKADGVGARTIERELQVGSAACKWCISEEEWDIVNPFVGRLMSRGDRKAVQPQARCLTQAEQTSLLLAAPPLVSAIIEFALETGFRQGEILALTHDRVAGSLVMFEPGDQKSRRHGVRALSARASEIVTTQPRDGLLVFHSAGMPLKGAWLRDAWQLVKARAGVQCKFHDLRKTWAVRARERGVLIQDASAQLGHGDIRVTQAVYALPGAESVLRAVGGQ